LVDTFFLTAECFMDHLINFMNNKCYLPFPLSQFPLIVNPSCIPYSFCSLPVLILITIKIIFVLSGWSGSVLSGLQWGFIGLIYSWLLLSLSSDHLFSPFIISYFLSIQTPHISQNIVSPPCSLINIKTICMDWIAWSWYIMSQIYFVFLRVVMHGYLKYYFLINYTCRMDFFSRGSHGQGNRGKGN